MLIPNTILGNDQDTLKNSIVAFPVGFYSPETRMGVGVAAAYNFRIRKKDRISPPSQIQMGVAYTQNKQLLLYLPFDIYFNERRHQVSGELGFYEYVFFYYGTRAFPQDSRESYQVQYPRVRLQYTKRIEKNFYSGIKYWWEDHRNGRFDKEGTLMNGIIPGSKNLGSTGGLGAFLLFDSRDNVYNTRTGYYAEGFLMFHNENTFSNYNFSRWRIDTRFFFKLNKASTIAIQAFGDFLNGNVPFFHMTGAGSSKRMRGYIEGRYRDHQMMMLQSEWRCFPFKRWGFALFGSIASVEHSFTDHQLNHMIPSAGVGVRYVFDIEKRINLRLDFAQGFRSHGFYFTIGESF